MNIDKDRLKALAEAAPEGPWFGPEYAPGTSYVFDVDLGSLLHYESIETEQDACLRYVAAANPAVVLALLAECDTIAAAYVRAGEREHTLRVRLADVTARLSAQTELLKQLHGPLMEAAMEYDERFEDLAEEVAELIKIEDIARQEVQP